ncbi:DNA polymerase III subunit alpha [Listeria marthii]|uniref:DNA polymerase III subunit alpha n=1 Tax=Listeria marthii TaxID=529731 RepID=UPI001628CEBD|nr:DNA polymerase III subunit alpha [Listeria marthii]MBC1970403.1 DNA polymerase III subunit alpha [Listeria marthii]MBC2085963.1 DNA polymerase III subunit alpha [Listeria marthii]
MGFVHLQVASAYDLLSSTASIDKLIAKAKEYHYPALAITDKNVLYGVVEFYQKCLAADIKPIIGMTVTIQGYLNPINSYELILIAESTAGYHQLLKIASAIQTREEGPELPQSWLRAYSSDLIAISPGAKGEVERLLMEENRDGALEAYGNLVEIFGKESVYLSAQKENPRLFAKIEAFSAEENVAVVATKNVQYMEPKDAQAKEVLTAIRDNRTVDWTTLPLAGPNYFTSQDEMERDWQTDFEKRACLETEKLAERCHVEIALDQHLLPRFPLEEAQNASEVLRQTAYAGLKERDLLAEEYQARLDYELKVITEMGFADYFLIVWDVIRYSREAGILTGPGRGSAAGSLVSYALRITDVDPIRYNLLFERFLNPERITMPDIDLDFPDNRRDEVISYVVSKYGEAHVAQIGTFGTLAAKAAIRDTARSFGLNSVLLSEWSKLIPSQLGITLQKALQESPRLENHIKSSKENEMIWDVACQLEGLPRHISTHAAGIVISDKPLVEQVALQLGSGDARLTQFAMGELEKIGLLKMDFLGLRNLSLLDRVLKSVNYSRETPLTLADISLEDKKTLKLFQTGDTTGVFQFESDGIRRVLRKLKPTSFEDVVAVDALYRPGPMEQIDTFIARKHGKEKIQYPHPDLAPILEVTYGVIVYQEQIIQVANQMAGFSLGEADLLRRAVSKKKADVLNEERIHFVEGAKSKGYPESSANQVYDMIVQFANYGFNRSHAAAYSKIAFQLAYLKAHYPAAFMSSLLSSVFGNDDKISQYITEAKNYGINMLAPSINHSNYYFQMENETSIRYSFRVIRKVPTKFILEIINERKKAPFRDFFDFCERMPHKMLTETVLEALVFSGCFDEFGEDRATIQATIDAVLQYISLLGEDSKGMNLFAEDDEFLKKMKPRYRKTAPISIDEKLEKEKLYTGQYVSAHPVSYYQNKLQNLAITKLANVTSGKNHQVAAYVHEVKSIRTKKGETMCFLTISDESKELSAVMFPESYRKYANFAQKGEILFLQVKADTRNGELQLIVNKAEDLKEIKAPVRLFLKLTEPQQMEQVKPVLARYKGDSKVIVHQAITKQTTELKNIQVTPSNELQEALVVLLGKENVVIK